MLGAMWSRNYTGEAETFVLWSQGGVEICLFLLDQTARMETKKVSTCRGSFGGFETTCFQLDRAGSLDSTGMFYFSCDRSSHFSFKASPLPPSARPPLLVDSFLSHFSSRERMNRLM